LDYKHKLYARFADKKAENSLGCFSDLNGEVDISIDTIHAFNGLFSPDYAECQVVSSPASVHL